MLKNRCLTGFFLFALFLSSVCVAEGQGLKRDAVSATQIGSGVDAMPDRATAVRAKTFTPLIAKPSETARRKVFTIGRLELIPRTEGVRLNSIDTVYARDPANPMGSRPGTSVTFDMRWRDR